MNLSNDLGLSKLCGSPPISLLSGFADSIRVVSLPQWRRDMNSHKDLDQIEPSVLRRTPPDAHAFGGLRIS
jgi:hypothetical protein